MFDVYGEFAVEVGGDDVIELLFTGGGSQTLSAGQGGTFAAGLRARPVATLPLSLFGSIGYKFVLNASDNADIRLTRIPIELGLRADVTDAVWAEAAYTRHAGITLYGDDFFSDVDFDAADGATLAAGWRWVGASYTAIRYTSEDGTEFDASNVGVTLRLALSDR
ncbi:MAG: hypothetical protein CMM84_00465 [Rhodothermaceae bacterium]|nr:hypothetical protein [Rhodothermaceae bacterium]MBC12584.1 hypothetical protein [Rhodothermaceae bacterium]